MARSHWLLAPDSGLRCEGAGSAGKGVAEDRSDHGVITFTLAQGGEGNGVESVQWDGGFLGVDLSQNNHIINMDNPIRD
ncbi:MAG TPA: hypothetical protein ENI99_03045 [Sedimenticola sp.]|nr:hypothetical protein [Sedimenticola sp.]